MSSAILVERDSYGWWRIDEETAQDKRKRSPQRFIKIAAPSTIDYLISKGYSVHMQKWGVGGYHPTCITSILEKIMNKKIALVTNVLDYVGPPAVKALLKGGYDVIAQDPAFQDTNKEKEYKIIFPGTISLGIKDPRKLIQYVWDNNEKVDVLISNDTFPAIHIPIEEANVEDLYATIENVLVYPFKLMKYAIPRLKKQGSGNVIMVTSCRTELPLPGGAIPDIARAGANALVEGVDHG